jgi:16S rRNA (guanine(527)-N(7))-methyltransferase RsmG
VPKTSDILEPASIGAMTRDLVAEYLRNYPAFCPSASFFGCVENFAAELARWGKKSNLTAVPDDPAELAFHIIDSLMPILLAPDDSTGALSDAFAAGRRILDLGSGAGFPGLILAAASEAEFVLIEARRKRASFLAIASASMGLRNVRVDHRHQTTFASEFDVVTARAFAQPAAFYEISGPALKPGGLRILYASARQKPAIDRPVVGAAEQPTFHEYVLLRRLRRSRITLEESAGRLLVVSRRPPN